MKNNLLPLELQQTIIGIGGDAGRKWVEAFPQQLEFFLDKWNLSTITPYDNLSFSFVAATRQANGTELVLKAGFPGSEEFSPGTRALEVYPSSHSVNLLAYGIDTGFQLLEKITPGIPLSQHPNDEEGTAWMIAAAPHLWITPPAGEHKDPAHFIKGLDRCQIYFERYGDAVFSIKHIQRAKDILTEYTQNKADWVLLHGDLHHGNMLTSDRAPALVIDPKGYFGPPIFELGPWLRNLPINAASTEYLAITQRRIEHMSAGFGFSHQAIIKMVFAQGLLSAWWMVEDGNPISVAQKNLRQTIFSLGMGEYY